MLFFDEATSSLDANNEKEIMQKIVVLEKGKIVEIGNHQELVKLKGSYYELVRNQLQLGS
jgi:ATP-binding cassette subfamily B protein